MIAEAQRRSGAYSTGIRICWIHGSTGSGNGSEVWRAAMLGMLGGRSLPSP